LNHAFVSCHTIQLKNWLGFRTIEEQRAAEEQARMAQKRAKTSSHGSAGAARGNKGNTGKSAKNNYDAVVQEVSSEEDDDSSAGEGSEEQEGSLYERDPALGELLQFVLSLPYVDEMWGIHDLILVSPAFLRGVVLTHVYDGVLPSEGRGVHTVHM
jgi:hypothetical protein